MAMNNYRAVARANFDLPGGTPTIILPLEGFAGCVVCVPQAASGVGSSYYVALYASANGSATYTPPNRTGIKVVDVAGFDTPLTAIKAAIDALLDGDKGGPPVDVVGKST